MARTAGVIHVRMSRRISFGILQIALFALVSCDGVTRVAGRVRDTRGRAMTGVAVRLERGTVSARGFTNSVGHYSVTQVNRGGKSPADVTFCKAGYHMARRWFDDSNSIPRELNVTLRVIDTTDTPARVAGARAPCEALGTGKADSGKTGA